MKAYRTPPSPLDDSNVSGYFTAGSALAEFMAGRLGAPGCWPDESHRKSVFLRAPDEVSSIQRWENDGGKTIAAAAPSKGPTLASQPFRPTRPLLTQLI
jgi:hypothetical protein